MNICKYQKLALIIILILVLAPIATFAFAKAINESSYKAGERFGYEEYHQCYTTHSCDSSENYYTPFCGALHIDNETACQHGYTHEWIHECLIDGGSSGNCKPQPDPTKYTYAKCIATGHDWNAGQCQSGILVGVTGPTVCHGQTCESGGSWVPVRYINHTAPDPGCTRLTDHQNYETCVGDRK
ncbi:MAG: hypothetical protein WA364_09580 [Candidatus Nitrosopolaris sp.]